MVQKPVVTARPIRVAPLDAAQQLRVRVADDLDQLLTIAYEMARHDPSCKDYWNGEARYWEQQRAEALKLVDTVIDLLLVHPEPTQQTTVIANVTDSANVVIGKDISQEVGGQ